MERLSDSKKRLGWYDRGYLPYFDAPGYDQAIPFRLADSMPKHVVDALDIRRFKGLLDLGRGVCVLREPWAASIVQKSLFFGQGERYDRLAWTVMPNHVHVLICLNEGWTLGRIVGDWKKHTAREINRILERRGRLWFRDCFDRYQRDPGHRERTVAYIEHNPVKARFCGEPSKWSWNSARFRALEGAIDWDRIDATVGRPGSHSGEWRSREAV